MMTLSKSTTSCASTMENTSLMSPLRENNVERPLKGKHNRHISNHIFINQRYRIALENEEPTPKTTPWALESLPMSVFFVSHNSPQIFLCLFESMSLWLLMWLNTFSYEVITLIILPFLTMRNTLKNRSLYSIIEHPLNLVHHCRPPEGTISTHHPSRFRWNALSLLIKPSTEHQQTLNELPWFAPWTTTLILLIGGR